MEENELIFFRSQMEKMNYFFWESSVCNINNRIKLIYQKIGKAYFKNLTSMKIIFYIELLKIDKQGVFNLPPIKELYRMLQETPKRPNQPFSGSFVNLISIQIHNIYLYPKAFAEIVDKYFSINKSNSLIFAYSTFPSIFGYFTTAEFCSCASEFLISYFSLKKDKILATSLIKSLFKSVSVFYENLFYTISENLRNNNDYQRITVQSIQKARSHISKWHIEAATAFMKYYYDEAIPFFINSILLEPFNEALYSSPFLSNKLQCDKYIKYLETLTKEDKMTEALEILDTFLYTDTFTEQELSLSKISWNGMISILFSSNDFQILYDILNNSDNKTFKIFITHESFPDSFEPFSIEVQSPAIKELHNKDFMFSLFGWKQSKIEISQENFDIYWNNLNQSIFSSLNDDIQYIKQNYLINSTSLSNIYSKINQNCIQNYQNIEKIITYEENYKRIIDFTYSVRTNLIQSFHYITMNSFKTIVLQPNPLAQNIREAITSIIPKKMKVDNEIFFELLLSSIDATKFHITETGKKYQKIFDETVESYIQHFEWEENYSLSNNIVKHVVALKYCDWTFGKMIKQIIQFENELQQVSNHSWLEKPNCTRIFALGLMANAPSFVFCAFLFAFHYIFPNSEFSMQCPDNIMQSWLNFSTAMWTIINSNPILVEISNNRKLLREFFTIHS